MATMWLLREPLKATASVSFSQGRLGLAAGDSVAREHLQTMTQYRAQLIELMSNFRSNPEAVQKAFASYMSELKGQMVFLKVLAAGQDEHPTLSTSQPADHTAANNAAAAPADGSKPAPQPAVTEEEALKRARQAILWKWTDNISGVINEKTDFTFEANNMTINYGLWFMKHAAAVADTLTPHPNETDDSAKEIFNALRRAAGVFQYLLSQHRAELAYLPNSDFDERIMEVRVQQCIAEAQEITLERARTKGHKNTLIAALARDEHEKYLQAADSLNSMDNLWAKRLRTFLLFKAMFFQAYMYTYNGIQLFSEEKCGDSISSLQAAEKALQEARQASKAFVKIPIPAATMHSQAPPDPSIHPAFKNLEHLIKTHLDKANRENGFIYFHKIPGVPPEPPAPQCLTEAIPFEAPPPSNTWETLKLDLTKVPMKGLNSAADKASGDELKVKGSPFDTATIGSAPVCTIS